VVAVIKLGHPPPIAWKYTPRQLHAILFIANRLEKAEHRALLALHMTAARGGAKDVKRMAEDLEK
jgi:hypothetical protein